MRARRIPTTGWPLPRRASSRTHVGLNRVNWNLQYDDPPALRHDLENQMNMVAGSTTPGPHGPQVIPGVYTLKLTVDGKVYTRDVTVMNDPRVGQSPALMAALRTQNKLTLLSVQGMEHSFAGHEEVDAVKDQLATLMKGNLPADVAAQAKTLDASLTKIGGVMPAGPGGFGGSGRRRAADPKALQSFFELNNALQHHGQHDAGRPRYGAHPHPDRHLAERLHRPEPYQDAWKTPQQQITDFNAMLAKNNLQEMKVAPTKLTASSCSFKAGSN